MRIRTFLKGEALQGCVIRFCDDFRAGGKKLAVLFDGEFLMKKTPGFVSRADQHLIGVYDPQSETFDFELMVSDILASMQDMGVCVEC